MENKRTVEIAELHLCGSVRDLHNFTYKVLLNYPEAMIEDDCYDDRNYRVTVLVDKTDTDLHIDSLQSKLYKLPRMHDSNTINTRVVVIAQSTPISSEKLAAIQMDGKDDKYYLHLGGCVLERYLTASEIEVLKNQSAAVRKEQLLERTAIEDELKQLRKLRNKQDAKYKLENL
jgi:hypothetical protein